MTTQKQIETNSQNAQLSTGPITVIGKAVVATNAIKHGIFTKDLILTSEIGQESLNEYREILDNLIDCLAPCNQMESLLVEKIAVDFWRLRRTIRFETGSIGQGIKKLLKEHYSYGTHDNEKIDEEIRQKKEYIDWNTTYLDCLRKGEVSFENPVWNGQKIKSDIIEDFHLIAKSIQSLTKAEREMLYNSFELSYEKLRDLLIKYGYSTSESISTKLIELISSQQASLEREIQQLSKKKIINEASNQLTYKLGMIPQADNSDKIMKYERSLQKSIYQNIFMLKKLQGQF